MHVQAIVRSSFVAEKTRRRQLARELGRKHSPAFELARRSRPFALRFHRRFETGHVDFESALARDVGGEIDRKSVACRRRNASAPGMRFGDFLTTSSKTFIPCFERLAEALLFGAQGLFDGQALLRELRIQPPPFPRPAARPFPEESLAHAEHPAVSQGAPNDPAQHITAAFVRRHHAIDDEKTARANVIGDHAQGLVLQIRRSGQFRRQRESDAGTDRSRSWNARAAARRRAVPGPCRCRRTVPAASTACRRAARSNCMNTRFQISM